MTLRYLVGFVATPFLWGGAVVTGIVLNNPTGYLYSPIEILTTFGLFYWLGAFAARWIFRKELAHIFKAVPRNGD